MTRRGRQGLMVALALATWAGSACGKGGGQANQAADTAGQSLVLSQPETPAALSDTAVAAVSPPGAAPAPSPAPAPSGPAPRKTTPTPRPTAPAPRKPAAPSSFTAAAGTRVPLAVTDSISSRTAHTGQEFTARVRSDVKDAEGNVVIPSGSIVSGTITEVKPGGASSAGTLTLAVNSVTVNGTAYPIEATVESATTVQQGRGVTGKDVAKVGAGAAAGAIAGRILGRNTRGTIIGGVLGAAAGAGVARATRTVDIVLPAGGDVEITLSKPVTVNAR